MPTRDDLDTIMIIGSGPIQIGQAAEFDYSGSQACKAIQEEGMDVVLVNSNPATIMTDPQMADNVYVEPLTPDAIERIIAEEEPDGIAAGLGGQKGLNIASEMAERGVLDEHGVEILGCSRETIETTEDRELFRERMHEIDQPVCQSEPVESLKAAEAAAEELGYPVVVRPAYTLGGSGGGIADDPDELHEIVSRGLELSRIGQVLVEESIEGWKEFEYELMRDANDTTITVVNMENVDPVGVHTGDSTVVTPSQTLTDEEHHKLRTAAIDIIRDLDIKGGCNIQFAVDPDTGDYRVIEVNPRVSRSSALASKATGYPIARVAAKISVGKDLHEIENDITKETPASFEPMIDYTVVKIPRWPFEKLYNVEDSLTTQMKGTGEVMAIGRTLEEAFQKAVRSLDLSTIDGWERPEEPRIDEPNSLRLFALYHALREGTQVEELAERTGIDPFYLQKLANIVDMEESLEMAPETVERAKQNGFTDRQIAEETGSAVEEVRAVREEHDILPTYRMVDTCAGEFEAVTPFFYSAFEQENEVGDAGDAGEDAVVIVGGGPIRIGQGIEFDYSCVHAIDGVNAAGAEAYMVNNNPETVSTDYDMSDSLFFEPLTAEDLGNIVERTGAEKVMVQFGGQTSVDVAVPLEEELAERGIDADIVGTAPAKMDLLEDRDRFDDALADLGIPTPESGSATSFAEAKQVADRIGYPVLVRPSYVIGGRAMRIVADEEELQEFMEEAVKVSPERPILVDNFLEGATELDVDAVADGDDVLIGGVMEHIEPAGVHSGDSACVLPPQDVSEQAVETATEYVRTIAREFDIVGFLNVQLAVQEGDAGNGDPVAEPEVYVLEANPRASRTIPYVSKHTEVPLARIAARVMMGDALADMDIERTDADRVSVKEVVFPFGKFEEIDMNLGPEMKSTGEVMGIADSFGAAYYKAQAAAGNEIPLGGAALVVTAGTDVTDQVTGLLDLGYDVDVREEPPEDMFRNAYDVIVDLSDTNAIKRQAYEEQTPYFSTIEAFDAAVRAVEDVKDRDRLPVAPLTEHGGGAG